ncbi:MAG: hypothetical protein JXA97_05490 [Anaerolineales bacterium]|nr:hypothetical protein [Anaerolineales bacterium]
MEGPEFIFQRVEASNLQVYQPFRPRRQGEWIAWACAAALAATVVVRKNLLGTPGLWAWLLAAFFLLSALLVSYGNWIAARTRIEISPHDLRFISPIHRVTFDWPQVLSMRFDRRENFWRVHVDGGPGRIHFDTPGLLGTRTSQPVHVGIERGDKLAAAIWQSGRLSEPVFIEGLWTCSKIKSPDA